MFTGIIQSTGKVLEISEGRIRIEAPELTSELSKGGSIAVDGCCLTAIDISENEFTAEVMPETNAKTILGSKQAGDLVNLELAMKVNGRFDGHIVSGHVEGLGEITGITEKDNSQILKIQIPDTLIKYVIPKGSIAINGISLTIIDVNIALISVGIIPHTWETTNLHTLKIGDKVNLETDLIAKYLEKFSLRH